MYSNKKILAIIPARSGSKGLEDKNIKNLNGQPLISYTIEAAKKSNIFEDIIVSTDSSKYAHISEQYGATIPFLRPSELSTDTANSLDVITYTLKELSNQGLFYDYFMLLQPTSPLRSQYDIKNSVDLLFQKNAHSVVSVCETEYSPHFMNTIDETLNMEFFLDNKFNVRRQELPKYYRLNGAIYLSDTSFFLQYKTFYAEKSFAYIMDQKKSIDIDSLIDFEIVSVLMKHN